MNKRLSGPATINGEVLGDLWYADKVMGEMEVGHIAGRTAIVPTTEAWVNIYDGKITVGGGGPQPYLDGEQKTGYNMSSISRELSSKFPSEIQAFSKSEIFTLIGDRDIRRVTTAIVNMWVPSPEESLVPKSLVFSSLDYAMFDVEKALQELVNKSDRWSKLASESLVGFTKLGFRQMAFTAVFNE